MTRESTQNLPQHLVIVMDGNGRWAQARHLPRVAGHMAGVAPLRRTVAYCAQHGIQALTVFAFSSENWRRPPQEVTSLQKLFLRSLRKELKALQTNDVRLRFIGDFSPFSPALQQEIAAATALTAANTGLTLVLAFNYGGRWDIFQAAQKFAQHAITANCDVMELAQDVFIRYLSSSDLPEPDLLIRTSGEYRLSNFLLWQLAYAELYFCDVLWPDFSDTDLEKALTAFAQRHRRFGRVFV